MPSYLVTSLLALGTTLHAFAAAEWGTQPLGKPAESTTWGASPIRHKVESRRKVTEAEFPSLELVKDGTAKALIILPASPSKAEEAAARNLVATIREATGVELPVAAEYSVTVDEDGVVRDLEKRPWANGIWIGKTRRAVEQKLTASELTPGGFKRLRMPDGLYILGNDASQGKLSANGTYFAVADLLERHLGVRWIWPGPGGTVVPKVHELRLPALNEQDEPAVEQRIIRNGELNDRAQVGLRHLKAEEKDYLAVLANNSRWLDNLRCGNSLDLNYKHAFHGWYKRYGKEHPEWFAMKADGSRTQVSERPRLCKSNPEVAHATAQQILAQYAKDPKLGSASISPNDGSGEDGFCLCSECRKLDPPNAPPIRMRIHRGAKWSLQDYVSLSDRLATFYNRIAEEVVKTQPHARLGAYAYSAYRDVPLTVTLHPAIIIGFVGLDYSNERLREKDLKRWDGWSQRANAMVLRPNALLGSYGLPFLYTRRLAEDVRHCYQTGMLAADFDSLAGHWSTQGLNYYVLAKILWDPSADPAAVVKDYCQAAFGPAATEMEGYFSEIEEASDYIANQGVSAVEEQLRAVEVDTPQKPTRKQKGDAFLAAYYATFTPEKIKHLRSRLEKARELAEADEDIRQRIDFLSRGLDYTEVYGQAVKNQNSRESLVALLGWYRSTFREEPHAFNTVTRLFRTGAHFRKLPQP